MNNTNCAREDKSNTERVTQLPQSIPVLNKEVDNSTQYRNEDMAIASPSRATSRNETKQQLHNQRKRKNHQDRLQQLRELNAKRR